MRGSVEWSACGNTQNQAQLAPARRRQASVGGQVSEERLDLGLAHRRRMPQGVKADESSAPVHVGHFGAAAVMHHADALAQLIEQAGRAQRR